MARSRRPATHAALPEALLAQLADRLEGGTQDFLRAMGEPPPTSIRLNPDKPFHMGQEAEVVAWCTHGRYLPERPAFTFDPLLHAGAYYVQEASSMFLERAVHAIGPWRDRTLALDMCASPGGKSTHLRSLLPKDALLVANEVEPSRRQALQENLWKWGGWNVVITGAPPAAFLDLGELFDLVLVDAPCSGEGMFRKDPFAREQWNPSLVDRCERVQREILPHAWELVAPGGHLIYSTCTWEERENEDRIASLVALGAIPIDIPDGGSFGIERTISNGAIGHRFYPHRVRGEGFFMGVVKKPGGRTVHHPPVPHTPQQALSTWFRCAQHLVEVDGVQHATDPVWAAVVERISSSVRNVIPGLPVAEAKGGSWRPHPALALNGLLDRSAFPEVPLDHDTAIAYLKGQALPAVDARGTALATHRGLGLGWLQGAGSRWNNKWPNAWRIRGHAPGAPLVSWSAHDERGAGTGVPHG